MSYEDTIRALTGTIKNLGEKDATFARSLIHSVEGRGFATEKQTYWLDQMLKKANGESGTTTVAVGDLGAVYQMFETAKAHLKSPKIVLGYSNAGRTSELTIYVAGPQSRTPGALQVKDADGTWWGRVHQDGNFEQSRRDPPPLGVTDILQRFAANPVGEASAHGFLTGKCCFCNRKLTDERSTAVGYGPVCAEHFGLAWGAKAASKPLTGDLLLEAQEDPVHDIGASNDRQSRFLAAWDKGGIDGALATSRDRPMHDLPDEGEAPEDAAERRAVARANAGHYSTGGY